MPHAVSGVQALPPHAEAHQLDATGRRLGRGRRCVRGGGWEPPLRSVCRSHGNELPGRTPYSMSDFHHFGDRLGQGSTKVCVYIFQCETQLLSPSISHFPVQKETSGSKVTTESASQVQPLWMREPHQGILIECPLGHPCDMLATICPLTAHGFKTTALLSHDDGTDFLVGSLKHWSPHN